MEKEREANRIQNGTLEEEASHFVQACEPFKELVWKTVSGFGIGAIRLACVCH